MRELYKHFLLLGALLFLVTLVLITSAFTPTSPLSSAAALSRRTALASFLNPATASRLTPAPAPVALLAADTPR